MKNKYLTEQERYQIEVLTKEGYKPEQIAKIIGKCERTIYRELSRGKVVLLNSNLTERVEYCADVAQRKYLEKSKNKGVDLKIGNDYDFVKFVEEKIVKEKYSPYAALEEAEKSGKFRTKICLKTLYNYIDAGLFLNISNKDLPVKKDGRKRVYKKIKAALKNLKGRSIDKRPEEIDERKELGHWEMDTVVSGTGKGKECLLVFTERAAREEMIMKIADKTMNSVVSALDRLEYTYGYEGFRDRFKTITMDNGCEFLDHEGIERSVTEPGAKRTVSYYCHPYSASERGSNENANKLIRRFVPKGSAIGEYSEEEISKIQDWVNNYPRKLFNGLSANEYRKKLLAG